MKLPLPSSYFIFFKSYLNSVMNRIPNTNISTYTPVPILVLVKDYPSNITDITSPRTKPNI